MRRRGSAVKEEVEAYLEGVEKRRQHATSEEGVGVAVGDVEKQVHAEAARARALEQAAGELDQRGKEWRWEICGGGRRSLPKTGKESGTAWNLRPFPCRASRG